MCPGRHRLEQAVSQVVERGDLAAHPSAGLPRQDPRDQRVDQVDRAPPLMRPAAKNRAAMSSRRLQLQSPSMYDRRSRCRPGQHATEEAVPVHPDIPSHVSLSTGRRRGEVPPRRRLGRPLRDRPEPRHPGLSVVHSVRRCVREPVCFRRQDRPPDGGPSPPRWTAWCAVEKAERGAFIRASISRIPA